MNNNQLPSTNMQFCPEEEYEKLTHPERIHPWDGQSRKIMPGFWLLGSLGKRVLRPGGIKLTEWMLNQLAMTTTDTVVEFAPGLGVTANLTLKYNPAEYVAIEKDAAAAALLNAHFPESKNYRCICADATETISLPDEFASVVYGESMLTIHSAKNKSKVLNEIVRLLKPKGKYALQEISLLPENLTDGLSATIRKELIQAVKHQAWPHTTAQWRSFLESHGFKIIAERTRPVRLLEADRLLEDEGAQSAIDFLFNILDDDVAVQRIRNIRKVFNRYSTHLCGYCAVCEKK
jgi:phospholipid N-methyltransferase